MVFSAALADLGMVFSNFLLLTMYFDLQLLFMKCLNRLTNGMIRKVLDFHKYNSWESLEKDCTLVCFQYNIYRNAGSASIVEFPICKFDVL